MELNLFDEIEKPSYFGLKNVVRYYSEDIIQKILDRADIVEIISETVPIKKAGAKHYKGLCPFHSETTPSFTVHRDRQFFYCFGCQTGGNVIHFLMKARGLTFPEAIEELASRYQIQLPKEGSLKDRKKGHERKALIELNEVAAEHFHQNLLSSKGKVALDYLTHRGVRMEEIKAHRIGYALAGWDRLLSFLQARGLSLDMAERLGLIIPKKDGGYYDRFRDRVMFPVISDRGEVIGFGGRSIGDGNPPKYMNSPDSILYRKGETLYGLWVAKRAITERDSVILVEGYFDLITLNRFDIFNVVATCGTALTPSHLRLIKRWTNNVILVFDSDDAGKKATTRSLEIMLPEGLYAKVITLPGGDDPDSFLHREGGERFKQMMESAIPLMDFFIRQVTREVDISSPSGRIRALETIVPMLKKIKRPVEMDYYTQKVADLLKVKEGRILEMMRKDGDSVDNKENGIQVELDPYGAEKLLIQLMLQRNDMIPIILKEGILKDFQSLPLRKLSERVASIYESRALVDFRQLSILLEERDELDLVSEFAMSEEKITDPQRILYDCMAKIRKKKINQEIERLNEDVKKSAELKDEVLMKSIITRLKELREERKRLILYPGEDHNCQEGIFRCLKNLRETN